MMKEWEGFVRGPRFKFTEDKNLPIEITESSIK